MIDILLDVPHIWQNGPGAPLANDCGQASVTGDICGLTVYCPTVYELSVQSGFATGKFTTVANLISMGATSPYKLGLWYTNLATLEYYEAAVQLGIVLTGLIDYRPVKKITGVNYDYAHFWNVRGRRKDVPGKPNGFWVNDSLLPQGPTFIPDDVFAAAINTPSLTLGGTNNPNIAVYPTVARAKVVKPISRITTGWNIDLIHNAPPPALFTGTGGIRLVADVSGALGPNTYGNVDLRPFFDRIRNYLRQMKAAGLRPLVVFTHETYGEGQSYNWEQMEHSLSEWQRWKGEAFPLFKDVVRGIDEEMNGEWDVAFGNQNDKPPQITDSIYIAPEIYGVLFRDFYPLVKSVNPRIQVVTAGFVRSAVDVRDYIRAARIADVMDGWGWHPYQAGATAVPYLKSRNIEPDLNILQNAFPGKRGFLQEFGGFESKDNPAIFHVNEHARGIWEVTADRGLSAYVYPAVTGMDGREGPLTPDWRIRKDHQNRSMIDIAVKIEQGTEQPPEQPPAGKKLMRLTNLPSDGVKFRTGPGTTYARVSIGGVPVTFTENVEIEAILGGIETANGYDWLRCKYKGIEGAFALNADLLNPSKRVIIRP